MVTPTTATATFVGASGKTYSVDIYIADAVGTACKFDSGSGAGTGSLPFWKCPEQVVLRDMAIVTGPTVITNLIVTADGAVIPGQRLRLTSFLTTLATRPPLNIGFRSGTNFGLTEA